MDFLTDTISETGAFGVPSKSQKSFICSGVGQTITLKSSGIGAPPQPPPTPLQRNDFCDLLGTLDAPVSKIASVKGNWIIATYLDLISNIVYG